jgi:hypothetical protein
MEILTPKVPKPFFSKSPNLPFLAQKVQMNFFFYLFVLSTIGACPRLLGEHVKKVLQKLTAQIVRL